MFGNSFLVEKFHNWKTSLKPSLQRSVTFHSTCLLLLSLCNCCCILGRSGHRRTRGVHTFLKKHRNCIGTNNICVCAPITGANTAMTAVFLGREGCWTHSSVLWTLGILTWGKVPLSVCPAPTQQSTRGLTGSCVLSLGLWWKGGLEPGQSCSPAVKGYGFKYFVVCMQ